MDLFKSVTEGSAVRTSTCTYASISGAGNSDTPGRDDQRLKVIVKVTKPLGTP